MRLTRAGYLEVSGNTAVPHAPPPPKYIPQRLYGTSPVPPPLLPFRPRYVPQRLFSRFPSADWYLIIDDDVFINADRLRAFTASRDPTELALYGPGFCEWGVPAKVMAKAGALLGIDPMPPAVHIVIGGIMLFTAAAVRKFADPDNVLKCIDDLETLYSNGVKLWGGLKESALYNQDWLFCWCMQV